MLSDELGEDWQKCTTGNITEYFEVPGQYYDAFTGHHMGYSANKIGFCRSRCSFWVGEVLPQALANYATD